MIDYTKSFIETQFPISKISKESYKERKSSQGQTLTGLGKWWGRKPLILVRSALLGTLLPATDNPKKDREIFLKILTMDKEGLLLRKKNIPPKDLYPLLTPTEQREYFEVSGKGPAYLEHISKEDIKKLQIKVFNRLSYDKKISFCVRPEQIENLPAEAWQEINNHLGTSAMTLQELVGELGQKRYGQIPRVGDCFAGGGSIPYEAARMGAEVHASDLNPIASLLTWASIYIAGASDEEVKILREFQQKVYDTVDEQVTEWGIEHNSKGHRADAYLYCLEVVCPDCKYNVPLSQSWVVGTRTKAIAILKDNQVDGFDIEITHKVDKQNIAKAEKLVTVKGSDLYCPKCEQITTSFSSLRKDGKDAKGNTISGIRKWEKNEVSFREDDVYRERLYCIRYSKEYIDSKGNEKRLRYYASPTKEDLARESRVIELLTERFKEWQDKGYIPCEIIVSGDKTDELSRTRGWQYWHQLFNPRQLLINGLFMEHLSRLSSNTREKVIGLLGFNKCIDYNSRLSRWNPGADKINHTFYNQALNTLLNYGTRTVSSLSSSWFFAINNYHFPGLEHRVELGDARQVSFKCSHIIITDPPYADAVNYHELSEFFQVWNKQLLKEAFPDWYVDSKRILAVQGTGKKFNESMVDIYKRLANQMPDNGIQIVMFTHQDAGVWAELSMILWSAGLRVVSAWTIATETEAIGLKSGNYVKGTVLMVLRKQTSNEVVFKDEVFDEIKEEVKKQIDTMRDLDDKDDPDFTDSDYLLAVYVSSLKVLTKYKDIADIDVQYELSKPRNTKEVTPIESIIKKTVTIAQDYLIPDGIDREHWRELTNEDRFYIRGLEHEINAIGQVGAYQELARGFGVHSYKDMMESIKANQARLKTASEYKTNGLGNGGFGDTLVRHLLAAVHLSVKEDSTIEGRNFLKSTYNSKYWDNRSTMVNVLEFIAKAETAGHMQHWHKDAYYAKLLKEAIKNDGV